MDERLVRGVAQFNARQFFAAHETWEDLWLDTVGAERELVQGLVQIAAGYLKAESGIRGGAIKLLTRGVRQLRQYPATALGLALTPFVAAVAADLQYLCADATRPGGLEGLRLPQLQIVQEAGCLPGNHPARVRLPMKGP